MPIDRLRRLQAIPASHKLDALLLIGGVDSRNDAGSREALNWLLNDLSGRDVFGSAKLNSALDEAVVLVMPDAVKLYAPRALWEKLQPRVARWRRLQVWTPPAALADDVEAMEEHKIQSFIAMVRGVRRVGVPLPAAATGSGPGAAIERWPLVQAFALQTFEHLTGGGFFTQSHDVVGVGESVRALLLQLDAPALAWLGQAEAPRLAACLDECVSAIDASCDAGRPFRASEAELFEPATVYHTHGQLRAAQIPRASAMVGLGGGGGEAAQLRHPVLGRGGAGGDAADAADAADGALRRVGVLVGARTGLLLSPPPGAPPPAPSNARVGDAGGAEATPRHLCAELAEAIGPLYFGRTYFLGSGARAPPQPPKVEEEALLTATDNGDADAAEAAAPVRKRTGARAAIAAAAAAAADASAFEDGRASDSDALQWLYGCVVAALDEAIAADGACASLAAAAGAARARARAARMRRARARARAARMRRARARARAAPSRGSSPRAWARASPRRNSSRRSRPSMRVCARARGGSACRRAASTSWATSTRARTRRRSRRARGC